MGTTKDAERKILLELTDLLLRNAERVVEGETKVCLTTSSLEILVSNFRRYSISQADDQEGEDEVGVAGGQGSSGAGRRGSKARRPSKQQLQAHKWRDSMRILLDFVMKIKALKIINSVSTLKGPIQLARFSALCVLEVKKVPVHMLEGLARLRGQLREITLAKSLQDLQGLLEICGGDRTSGLVWSCLTTAVLSFNGIATLDPSLRLVPFLAVLDLSHNNLKDTGEHLLGLTDVVKLNLGYNLLSKVPSLNMLNKGKLQTLVLRNNNLDNLDGVEELVQLEELDVSENCFLDHTVLQVLPPLNRLRMLQLVGNPLCYKADHRYQTLKRLSPQTANNHFILDSHKMSQYEASIVRTNSQFIRKSVIIPDEDSDMETIVVSHKGSGSKGSSGKGLLEPGGASGEYERGRKRGHRRVHSKERRPVIGNIQEAMSEEHSRDTSPVASVRDEPDFQSEVNKDRQRYEILREHYKDDWLKALTTEHGLYTKDKTAGASDKPPGASGKPTGTSQDKAEKPQSIDTEKVVNGEDKSQTDQKEPFEVVAADTVPAGDMPDGASQPVNLGDTVHIMDTTDLYASRRQAEPWMAAPVQRLVEREDIERDEGTDSDDQYGEESEPLIVMLPDSELRQIFVTVNNRFILEKDTNGRKLTKLDLKSLQGVQKVEEELRGEDIVDGQVFTVLTLDFDYVRKDMRRRRYAMEDDNDALVLESLISPYLKMKEEQARVRDVLECLKCKHQFSKRAREDLVSCPQCRSKHVIKVEEGGPADMAAPTAQPPALNIESQNQDSPTHSCKRSPALVRKRSTRIYGSGSDPALHKNTSAGSLSEFVEKLLPEEVEEPANKRQGLVYSRPEVTFEEEAHQTSTRVTTAAPTLQPTSSWSDMQRLSGSQTSQGSQSATRSSISSVESDITVLATNSRGSVGAIISESSYEILETGSGGNMSGTVECFQADPSGTCVEEPGEGERREDDDTGSVLTAMTSPTSLATPVGSPLSNSVCSSMVSSVYENTLPGVPVSPPPGNLPGGGETAIPGAAETPANMLDSSFTSSSSDSVSIRHSSGSADSRSRRSKHRNLTMYQSENENQSSQKDPVSDFSKSHFLLSTDASSIYDTAVSQQTDESSLNSTNISANSTFPSIYDKGTTDSDSEKPNDSGSFLAVRPRSRDTGSGLSSSPHKRSGTRSRSRSANRSAIYGDSVLDESGESHSTAGLAEFPSHLSPIKKHPGQQRAEDLPDGATNGLSQAEHSDVVLRGDKDDSVSVASGNSSMAGEKALPWEQEDTRAKSAKHESLIHDEFVNIDHRIQLYLELHVLRAEELIQCAVQCPIVQYMIAVEVKSLLVITSTRIVILKIQGDLASDMSVDTLKLYEDQPISQLQYVDIGLGYQSLRLEFSTDCSSYSLLLCDEARCKQFLTLLSDIAQTTAMHEHSQLEGISKSNPTTLANLQQIVGAGEDGAEEGQEEEAQVFVRYLLVTYLTQDTEDDEGQIVGLIVTTTDLILVRENQQWPLPRLQAPLSADVKGEQFTVLHREKINNIEQFAFNKENHSALKLTFDESSDADNADGAWYITMETTKGVKSLVDAIREPWEAQFGVSLEAGLLEVTSTSFTDDSVNQQ